MQILPLSEIPSPRYKLETAERIFFEASSKKTFSSDEEREAFRRRYFTVYADRDPEWFLLALDDSDQVLGYLAGTPSTREDHLSLNPYLEGFRSVIGEFPAHLHINFCQAARGLGLGSRLLEDFESRLKAHSVTGVHLVTGAKERNVGFYARNGYSEASRLRIGASELVFLGKRL